MNVCLQAEIDWINGNIDHYDSPLHAKAVIGSITKRYAMTEITKLITKYNQTRNTRDQLELFDWLVP